MSYLKQFKLLGCGKVNEYPELENQMMESEVVFSVCA